MSHPGSENESRSGDEFERIIPMVIGPAAPLSPSRAAARPRVFPAALVWAALVGGLVLAGLLFWLILPVEIGPNERVAKVLSPSGTAKVEESTPAVPSETGLAADEPAGAKPAGSVTAPTPEAAPEAEANDAQALEQHRLQAQTQTLLARALSDGRAALAAGDAEAAGRAYAQALGIDPHNEEAKAGRHRAGHLAALRTLIERASVAEASGDPAAAADAYRQALDLDGQSQQARDGLNRVQSALADEAFRVQMSRGLTALDRGDFDAAGQAFEAALRQRPGAVQAGDGLARVRIGREQQAVTGHRQRAEAAELAEQWPQARDAYAAALAVDGSLAFARSGRERAAQRADLDLRLRGHIDHPDRLGDAQVRADAAEALAMARKVQTPGPRLRAQIDRLDALVMTASTPVQVTLRSDGQTQVVVYRVGDLGRFESRQQALLPGSYTAVGRRPGYRDVRVNFVVTARGDDQQWTIRCEELI